MRNLTGTAVALDVLTEDIEDDILSLNARRAYRKTGASTGKTSGGKKTTEKKKAPAKTKPKAKKVGK